MNNVFTAKLLQNLNNKKGNKGFTLIELLVVVIIIGVLAAVALPNLLGQVGKARETEAKTTVGAVNRAQQANRIERPTFADSINLTLADNLLGVVVPTSSIYSYTIAGDADLGTVTADAGTAAADNGVRNYAGAVSYGSGAFATIVCQTDTVGGTVAAPAGATATDCPTDTTLIR
ncbi:type IV pilin-like G/H family protein [Pleurocapsa sp. PCC 7319]|uniref:type IV pilin-like G/H family protein n=1 Tax=Pleurocapsa sp. PCC 7319 TaxID=118161 RepID=UPI00034B6013|nr:type IV pilin-like G/H family protein [Pleurocapsa sp. PCC 7319]